MAMCCGCLVQVLVLNPQSAKKKIALCVEPTFGEGHVVASRLATFPLLIGPPLTKQIMPSHHI